MNTNHLNFKLLRLPVLVLAVCLLTAIAMWKVFGGRSPFEAKPYTVNALVTDASGITAGSQVRISGVNVGRVLNVTRAGDKANLNLEIWGKFAPLKQGAKLTFRSKTLLGEPYLQVAMGDQNAPVVPEGGQLPLSATVPQQKLEQVLQTFDSPTRLRLAQLFGQFSDAFKGQGQQINSAVGSLSNAGGDLANLTGELVEQRQSLQQLVATSADVLQVSSNRSSELKTFITSGNSVLRATAEQKQELRQTMRALPGFLTGLRSSLSQLQTASPELSAAARSLKPVASELTPALQQVVASGPVLNQVLADVPAFSKVADTNLPKVESLVGVVDETTKALYPDLRELIPTLQLLAANREGVVGTLANVGNMFNGKIVGMGNSLQSYGVGVPSIWNEIIAGWANRLNTNRKNSYGKPGGSRTLAEKGYLTSFDCSHANNPQILPPFGPGAPPCVEQGPWTFNGKTAYYPRLDRAAP